MSARFARVRAFAKINLSLKVLYKRPDNYHELRTVFQTVGLHDTIGIEYENSRRTELLLEGGGDVPDNLILRAARSFLDSARTTARIRFRLQKRIPMGGGLGGGSSDAAAVLLALPVLSGKPFKELALAAATLGSDVPFFLHGGTALGVSRGEEVYPLPEPPRSPVLIVTPSVHVSTPEAYRSLGRCLTSPDFSNRINIFQSFVWRESSVSATENDFEGAVFGQYPELRRWLRRLEASGARPARMSGSGSSLFGIYSSRDELRRALPLFPQEKLRVFSTTLVSRRAYRAAWWRSLQEHIDGLTWPPRSRYLR
ncbi:MAG: 4-(cytidine 5'-diphospho)-2-C-methyl-D-erythritol kinase [Bryobacterales bacterium]|nr:4-(cytidine 5'-diphospho)-2-C-methyl-D-erythritol kinase [Bryobacterales bacterium]